jgi:lipoate---protein ligase
MRWRIIPLDVNNAFMNMAIDEALAESVKKNNVPIIRFYKWLPSAVSIGYFQSLNENVNVLECDKKGITIVRRRTGGGTVYHSNSGEITYSVIGPVDMFPKNIIKSYELICGWVIKGLNELGIKSEFSPINDIVVNSKKISGNAQTRRNKILLQHGTILHDVNVKKMFSLLKVSDEKMKDKLIKVVEERVTSVLNFKKITSTKTYEALLTGFTEGKTYDILLVTDDELDRAEQLVKLRYSTKDWNYMK